MGHRPPAENPTPPNEGRISALLKILGLYPLGAWL